MTSNNGKNTENNVAYHDEDYTFGKENGITSLIAAGRHYRLTCHPYEPCLYIADEDGKLTSVHNSFDPDVLFEIFYGGGSTESIKGRKYTARDFCQMVEYAAGKGDIGIDDAEKVFRDTPKKEVFQAEDSAMSKLGEKHAGSKTKGRPATDSYIITNGPFFDIIQKYPDAVPEYCLVKNDGGPSGINAHKKALERACSRLMAGDEESEAWNYDLSIATAHKQSVRELFSNEDTADKLTYHKAFLRPPYECEYTESDFEKVNAALFPCGTEHLEVFEWSTDWSDYFDDGHEWWGTLCLTIYDRALDRFVVILASSTD